MNLANTYMIYPAKATSTTAIIHVSHELCISLK